MQIVQICFFLSGFCSLLYQIVWLRLAMANFGVNAPIVSSVLAVFMLGLALGSWMGGHLAEKCCRNLILSNLRPYALLEFVISIGGLTVPTLLAVGRKFIWAFSMQDALSYFSVSLVIIIITLIPFCVAMGATYPFALSFLQNSGISNKDSAFSGLYLTNVTGSLFGVLVPTFITIELFGFQRTLLLAVVINFLIAVIAWFWCSGKKESVGNVNYHIAEQRETEKPLGNNSKITLLLLGLCSMALEVVWTRLYTPYIGTWVYSFAAILVVYLLFTNLGTVFYLSGLFNNKPKIVEIFCLFLSPAVLLSSVSCNPYFTLNPISRILFGVAPFSLVTGALTPYLIDVNSKSRAYSAGVLYAFNLIGCLIGPLLSGFFLIPLMGANGACFLLALFLLLTSILLTRSVDGLAENSLKRCSLRWFITLLAFISLLPFSRSYESQFRSAIILHDYAATVIASGFGLDKQLRINGKRTTHLTTITKMMAHLPLAHLANPPERGLVICLGMGMTFRSMISWGIDTTVVELVPSVAKVLPFFVGDAEDILKSEKPKAVIVIDDGRRYLDRTDKLYDVIAIDPPPPIETAQSSLLYSEEFYKSVKKKLKDTGILQNWLPQTNDTVTIAAVVNALQKVFPYVRIFRSFEGHGFHFLASSVPIRFESAYELTQQMPEAAKKDLVEWESRNAEELFLRVLQSEKTPEQLLSELGRGIGAVLKDDRPINEYWFLRRGALGNFKETDSF